MKNILSFVIILLFISNFSVAQPWQELLPEEKSKKELTFFDYQKAFNDYWEPYNVDRAFYIVDGKKVKAPGWKQFKRWEYYMEGVINPTTGELPKANAMRLVELNKMKNPYSYPKSTIANWSSIGPDYSMGGYAGIGRINCVAFHPDDNNTYWVGAASGGLWKTNDNGTTWICLTDANGVMAVSDIVIPSDYATSNTIYIATGDRDAWDNHSIGVLKSIDDGLTWNTTGLSYNIGDYGMVNRILLDPNDNQTLIAATSDGVYKTTDGGNNWNISLSYDNFIDMEYKPGDFNTLYGSTKYGVINTSVTGGASWTQSAYITGGQRIELAVSENDPSFVYAVVAGSGSALLGVYKSTDSGTSFNRVFAGTSLNLLGWYASGTDFNKGQGWYDLCITAAPGDANTILIGGINTWRSTNGGLNWEIVNHWWGENGVFPVHADKHTLKYRNNGDLFEGNDGGIYISNDNGTSWSDVTNGMRISQMYKLGVSATEPDLVITGLQDNGTKLFDDGAWADVKGGDGMECIIDYSDANIQYGTYVYGQITITTDRWMSWENRWDIEPVDAGDGAWVTPYIIDPNIPTTLYAGYADVWKTTDRGNNWTKISDLNITNNIRSMAIAPSNTQVLYITDNRNIWKTINGGISWNLITGDLPVDFGSLTSIAVKNDDSNTVWVTFGGYNEYGVYQSVDGGTTWTDISNGLPNIPSYSIVQNKQMQSNVHLYVGTELGVYFKEGSNNWIYFNDGLPNVKIGEIEIYYDVIPEASKLRAATYGRGLWETLIYANTMSYVSSTTTQTNTNDVYLNVDGINQEIIGIQILTENTESPLSVSSFGFNTNGSSNPITDIANAKLFYTGTSNVFSTTIQIGVDVNNPNGIFNIPVTQELLEGTNYFWLTYDLKSTAKIGNKVDAQCTSITINTPKYPTVTNPDGSRKITLKYCDAGSNNENEYISGVTINTIANTSMYGNNGYQDFTSLSTNVVIGQETNFSLNVINDSISDQIIIWADLNRDGIFSDDEERLFISNGVDFSSPFSGTFIIPNGTTTGNTSLRIRLHNSNTNTGPNSTACGNSLWGEVEDYTINIKNSVGVDNQELSNEFLIFPNPATNEIQILNDKYKILNVIVCDFTGRELLYISDINSLQTKINIENLISGAYILKVKTANGMFSSKIIKK